MTNEEVTETLFCLITRPAHQAAQLNAMLQQAGLGAINFPTIAIQASSPTPFLQQLQNTIKQFDIALFVSRNAVDFTFKHINSALLPNSLELGVIGKGTWQALKNQGVESQLIPAESYNSEGLLASRALQHVEGKNIIIFRGQQGRNLLGDTLQQRGASVEYQEVYQRMLPEYATGTFEQLTAAHFPDIAVFTSAEGLSNCFQLVSESIASTLCKIPWLLISERMRETARKLGHNADIIIANSASDEGIFEALQKWKQTHKITTYE